MLCTPKCMLQMLHARRRTLLLAAIPGTKRAEKGTSAKPASQTLASGRRAPHQGFGTLRRPDGAAYFPPNVYAAIYTHLFPTLAPKPLATLLRCGPPKCCCLGAAAAACFSQKNTRPVGTKGNRAAGAIPRSHQYGGGASSWRRRKREKDGEGHGRRSRGQRWIPPFCRRRRAAWKRTFKSKLGPVRYARPARFGAFFSSSSSFLPRRGTGRESRELVVECRRNCYRRRRIFPDAAWRRKGERERERKDRVKEARRLLRRCCAVPVTRGLCASRGSSREDETVAVIVRNRADVRHKGVSSG